MSRTADVVVAGVLLAFTLPLMIAIAGVIKLDSPGPVFERKSRIGRDGRRLQILKFRTMGVHGPAEPRPGWAAMPQVTRVGAFLRYTQIDRLPQFLNVLAGDMSYDRKKLAPPRL